MDAGSLERGAVVRCRRAGQVELDPVWRCGNVASTVDRLRSTTGSGAHVTGIAAPPSSRRTVARRSWAFASAVWKLPVWTIRNA